LSLNPPTSTSLEILSKMTPTTIVIMPCECECDDWSKADFRKLNLLNK
jgi:hypothetical protein